MVQVSEELQLQKDENFRLNNYIEQIVQDLDEKTPALQQLRRDYDRAEQNCQQLSQKLNGMFEECESMRLESEDARRNANADKRENERLKQLCNDLGRQVKVSRYEWAISELVNMTWFYIRMHAQNYIVLKLSLCVLLFAGSIERV